MCQHSLWVLEIEWKFKTDSAPSEEDKNNDRELYCFNGIISGFDTVTNAREGFQESVTRIGGSWCPFQP